MQISSSAPKPAAKSTDSGGGGSARLSVIFDPPQGITPAPITVKIGGRVYTAPARTAGGWLEALYAAGWLKRWRIIGDPEHDPDGLGAAGIMDVCCNDARDAYRLALAIDEGTVSVAALAEAGRKVIAKASGVDWWIAERLALQSVSWSGIGGELYVKGLRPHEVPLPVWLGATYRTWMGMLDDKARTAADTALSLPPAGYDSDEPLPASLGELFV